jgi:hypothetical protein
MKTLPSNAYSWRRRSVCAALVAIRPLRLLEALLAGVHQHEATGAIGILRQTGAKAGLAEQGGLLVAGDAADGDFPAEQVRAGFAIEVAGGMHRRQDLRRDYAE